MSLALQLSETDAAEVPNGRLTDKFPSSTTLWQVLRKFEDGVAGVHGGKKNLTAKGAPSTGAGAGRLFYQQPVLQVMNRELYSFTDLQKTLAQLGLNSGSALIRLSYRQSSLPLEDAMVQIQAYFDSTDIPPATQKPEAMNTSGESVPDELKAVDKEEAATHQNSGLAEYTQDGSGAPLTENTSTRDASASDPFPEPQDASVTSRPVSVYRPPTATTPSAASIPHNEADYTPTVEHATIHQRLLNASSRNQRMPSEAEITKQREEEAEKLAAIKEVEVKIRFPDQSAVSSKFGQNDTGANLYDFVRECLDVRYRSEIFMLRNPGVKGKNEIVFDNEKRLIKDVLLRGRVLVVFAWDDSKASVEARGARTILKSELQAQAQDFKPPEIAGMADDDKGMKVNVGKQEEKNDEGGSGGKKMPKWLKGLAKK